jgi:hypothetical protein
VDAKANSGKGSLRNEEPATKARWSEELDNEANPSFDDRNAEKFFKSSQNQKVNTGLCPFFAFRALTTKIRDRRAG